MWVCGGHTNTHTPYNINRTGQGSVGLRGRNIETAHLRGERERALEEAYVWAGQEVGPTLACYWARSLWEILLRAALKWQFQDV